MSMFEKLESASEKADSRKLWKGTFRDFLQKYEQEKMDNANIGVLAHARLYNMILAAGTERKEHFGKERTSFAFFEKTLYGIEDSLDDIMKYLASASQKTETSRRMLLMYGPPSSGKSDIVQHLKRGLEEYTRTKEGAIFALSDSKMHENPFLLVPEKLRPDFEKQYGLRIEGQLTPPSAQRLRDEFHGKFMDFPVEQIFLDEASRRGIGTWLPQDPKTVSTDTTKVYLDGYGIVRLSSAYGEVCDRLNEEGFAGFISHAASLDKDEKINGIYDHGMLPMFRVNAGGVWIDCTANHRLMTLNKNGGLEWKPLKDIDDDCPVLIKTDMQKFADEPLLTKTPWTVDDDDEAELTYLSPEMSEVLGGLVAEGACTSDNFFYCNTDKGLVDRFSKNIEKVFKTPPTTQMKMDESDEENFRGVRLSSRLSRWLDKNFNLKCGACVKSVPDLVLGGTKKDHIAFLEGLFLGDASIRFKKDKVARFSFSTCSETLATDVQSMLLNLGVFTRIHGYTDKKYPANTQYQIVCEGEEAYAVAIMFPEFAHHRKFNEAAKTVERVTHCRRYEFFGSLSGLITEIRENTKGTRDLIDRRYAIKTGNKRTPTRRTLEKWYNELNANVEWTCSDRDKRKILDKLDTMLSYRCVPIINTEYIGVKHGVDLSCEAEPFSYIANGFVSHNSSDQSELVGGMDFAKLQQFGDETDPRSYNFNGELNVANRGVMEFIEGLKADERFLRVLLTATQEKAIKAPRFGLIYCDTVIILHTNEEEFKNFMAEKKYEAYHDRMVIVKVPYNLSVSNEVRIYEKLLSKSDAIKNMHIAPKTLQATAMFSILTRLAPTPEGSELTLVKKMKLYDDQHVRGFKCDQVPDMKKKTPREGMSGVSPRFTIDQISVAIATARDEGRDYVTALDVLRQLKKGVTGRDSFSQDTRNHYDALVEVARSEWDDLLRNDIQKAFFVSYEKEARNLCENYLDQIDAACSGTKPRDPITGDEITLDEKLMDSVEEQIDITSSGKEDFRNEILRAVGAAARSGKKFDYTQHSQLREAIQKKLFEERKNVIRMTVSTRNPDPDELKRINDVVARMVEQQGYSEAAANSLLKYATSHLFDK